MTCDRKAVRQHETVASACRFSEKRSISRQIVLFEGSFSKENRSQTRPGAGFEGAGAAGVRGSYNVGAHLGCCRARVKLSGVTLKRGTSRRHRRAECSYPG